MTADFPSFDAFYRAVHGHEPFPWQSDLATEVLARRRWPDRIAVPTGLGKTSVIDVAVYVAVVAGFGPDSPARRRICFVIDRRIVVDEAHQHASKIADCLADDQLIEALPALQEARKRLEDLGAIGQGERLTATRMRGGVDWESLWLDRPDRLAIVTGTVDQLGSRLMFRGYGVSPRLAPIDAALVGNDSLIIVDEAHLAEPFRKVVDSALTADSPISDIGMARSEFVVMTATQRSIDKVRQRPNWTMEIGPRDRENAEVKRRLNAEKRLHLVLAGKRPAVTTVLAECAIDLAGRMSGPVVGVVCNTVGRARKAFDIIGAKGLDAVLLTGRVRGADRDRNLGGEVTDRFAVGRSRPADGTAEKAPLFVVATQTIEVGVNADFDALVTEVAPWPSLVQRLGRLNRIGAVREPVDALVVGDEGPNPVYDRDSDGPAKATWEWLTTQVQTVHAAANGGLQNLAECGFFSVSVQHILDAGPDIPKALEPALPDCPALGVAQWDAWARTSPRPATDPPLDSYLHGINSPDPQIRVAWRADLPQDGRDLAAAMAASVDRNPVKEAEVLEVPLKAFRAWFGAMAEPDIVDMPAAGADDSTVELSRTALAGSGYRMRSDGDWSVVKLTEPHSTILANDTIVLPATAGGCDRWGWAPDKTTEVDDLVETVWVGACLRRSRGSRLVHRQPTVNLRLLANPLARATERQRWEMSALLARAGQMIDADLLGPSSLVEGGKAEEDSLGKVLYDILKKRESDDGAFVFPGCTEGVYRIGEPIYVESPDPHWVIALVQRANRSHQGPLAGTIGGSDASTRGDDPVTSSRSLRAVTLKTHGDSVADRARDIADCLGLPEPIRRIVVEAARRHDLGKLDDRFQAMLRYDVVDPFADLGEILAKSGMDPADRDLFRRAHRASGLPDGFRHEVGSAHAAAQVAASLDLADEDLFVHLVAAHHGHARPLFPPVLDTGGRIEAVSPWQEVLTWDPSISIDWTQPTRFDQLNQRYGRWGLALLESIVRLADIGCSREGS